MLQAPADVRSNSRDDGGSDFLVQVVHLHYQRGLTQKEVASRLGVSAMTISRALKRAEDVGLVEIRLHLPVANDAKLENELRQCLGIREAFVARLPSRTPDEDERLDFLGRATALFITDALVDGVVLGIALGKTVGHVARHLPRRRLQGARVVQVMGGLDQSSAFNSYDIVQLVSSRLGAQGHYFAGPAMVANASVQLAMFKENTRAGLETLWENSDLCLTGIGSCTADVPYVRAGLISSEDIEAVVKNGAVGDVFGHYFDASGRFIRTELDDRVNAISLEQARRMKRLVVTAGGQNKVQPIIGLARTGLPVSLVTDQETAQLVLAASTLGAAR